MKTAASKIEPTTGPKLWIVMARAHGALAWYVEASVADRGLCLSDFMVLEVLLHKGPMAISDIGRKVLLANASMTSAVDRLERKSFVVRRNSESDRRAKIVELTSQGSAFISELYERHVRDLEVVTNVLSDREKLQLRKLLKKLGRSAETAAELRAASRGRT